MKIQSVVLVLAIALALIVTFSFHYSSQAHSDWDGDAYTGMFKARAWVTVTVPDPGKHNVGFTTPDHAADVKVCVNFDWKTSQKAIKGRVIAGFFGNEADPGIADVSKWGTPWMVKEAHAKLTDDGGKLRVNDSDEYNGGCDCGSSSS